MIKRYYRPVRARLRNHADKEASSSAVPQNGQAAHTVSDKIKEILRDLDHTTISVLSTPRSNRVVDEDDTYTKGKQLSTEGKADEEVRRPFQRLKRAA